MNVKYIGYFAEESGYGVAARRHALALARCGVRILGHSILVNPERGVIRVMPRRSTSSRLHRMCQSEGDYETVLVHTGPWQYSRLVEEGRRNIALGAWEADTLPRAWQAGVTKPDEIWVPSAFSVEAFARASKKPVHVVPHPVYAPPPGPKDFPGVPPGAFVFANVMEWQQRKNPLGIVRAFSRAFQGRRDVVLVMKLGRRLGLDEKQVLAQLRDAEVRFAAPPVRVFFADGASDRVIAQLYRRANAYVSLHRAEGFGLCLAEAMAAGLPVVATRYSGNLEYMDEATGFLVGYRKIPIEENLSKMRVYESGMEWADPSLDEAVDQLRACVSDGARRTKIAAAGKARVDRMLSTRAIGERMRALLG